MSYPGHSNFVFVLFLLALKKKLLMTKLILESVENDLI